MLYFKTICDKGEIVRGVVLRISNDPRFKENLEDRRFIQMFIDNWRKTNWPWYKQSSIGLSNGPDDLPVLYFHAGTGQLGYRFFNIPSDEMEGKICDFLQRHSRKILIRNDEPLFGFQICQPLDEWNWS